MYIQAVGKDKRRAVLHVGGEVFFIDFRLQLIRGQHHDHVAPFRGIRRGHDLEACAFRLGGGA